VAALLDMLVLRLVVDRVDTMNIDVSFLSFLTSWSRDDWALCQLFSPDEIRKLQDSRCGIHGKRRTVVYLVYENHFARGGGIFAVAKHLPPGLARRNSRVVVLSPFHPELSRAPRVPGDRLGDVSVGFAGKDWPTDVYRYRRDGMDWILFHADGFFAAQGDSPYNQPNEQLLRNGLFACAAVPNILAMRGVDLTEDVIVHAQDWQMAATALTVKQAVLDGRLKTAAVVLTSHNPYDCGLNREALAALTDRTGDTQWARLATPMHESSVARRATVYECMMPLMDAPVSTVSRQYARDLVSNPLLTAHFADHLQQVLHRQGLVGIDNGLFMAARSPFSRTSIQQAARGDVGAILQEKADKRRKMLRALSHFRPAKRLGFLRHQGGWDLTELPDDVPVWMMFGRLDPAQKGFDLLAQAIRRLPPNRAKFVICPLVPSGVDTYLDHWREVACSRPGDVVVYTGRVEPYVALMAGATFCVMPSFHEPFGAATEPYLMGTPVVAAATGGLIQQVVDYRRHPDQATGLLYEHACHGSIIDQGLQWEQILDSPTAAARMHSGLYVSLVNGLTTALQQASELFRNRPADYGQMLGRLYDQALKFSWDKSAAEYSALYARASAD
jgi:glycogen synthase